MVDMLSRARFEDEDGMVSENEEVGADFFESARMRTEGQSAPPVNEFDEDGYNRKIPEDNDDGHHDDKRRGRTAPKEGVPVLSTERRNLEGPEKVG